MARAVDGIAVVLALTSAPVASAAIYYLEAENADVMQSTTVYDEDSGGLGGDPMSNNYYVTLDASGAGRVLFQINQGDLPAGTYNIADRGYSSNATRELDLQIASGIVGIDDPGFSLVGMTNNVNNAAPAWPIEWRRLYNATTGSTLATIIMPPTGGITLRYTSQGSAPGSSDVLAFMTVGEALPANAVPAEGSYTPQIPVPEPTSMGIIALATGVLLARRRGA